VNLILFQAVELEQPLPRSDPRAQHLLQVLRRQVGDSTDVGLVNGPRGKAVLRRVTATHLWLDFDWGSVPPPPYAIWLIVGLSRPQTCRRILHEAAALGVERMSFVSTERAEPTYAASRLWTTGEYQRHVLDGVEQAFSTHLPLVDYGLALEEALASAGRRARVRCALDNYEATMPLGRLDVSPGPPAALAVGSERGWTAGERQTLRAHGFALVGLGDRVLRTETAVVAGVAVLQARTGMWT
jgi:16S rRNA (uracil1498-N3)-methyltransferase